MKWFRDSQAAAKIVETGSMQLELHKMAIDIFNFSLEHGLTLDIQWIPREQNTRADFISDLIDPDDWQITEEVTSTGRLSLGTTYG